MIDPASLILGICIGLLIRAYIPKLIAELVVMWKRWHGEAV